MTPPTHVPGSLSGGHMALTGEGLLGKTPTGFRRRVFMSILVLSVLTSTVTGAAFYSLQGKFIASDRARRANTLLTSLATQAELGAYADDAALLELPVRRSVREEDVVLAGVYDLEGREIHALTKPSIGAVRAPDWTQLEQLRRDPDALPITLPGNGYEDLWAPIVTTMRPAAVVASSEPGESRARREVVGLARIGLSLKPAHEQLAEVLATVAALSVVLLILGAFAAILVARRLSGPILALARGADEIRSGNLAVRIDVATGDELGTLADSFNRMAANLRETVDKLASLNQSLEAEVTRRTDEIRRSAEFTQVLNAPIADTKAARGHELKALLEAALDVLTNATGVRAAAVLLDWEEALDFELKVAASRGLPKDDKGGRIGTMPTRALLQRGAPYTDGARAIVPIVFRGDPEGAFVLLDDAVPPAAVEFASRAAGQLAIAIANAKSFDALRHLTEQLTRRNTELTKQRDQLEEMNRLKSEFLANVSHELRTPLNAISGYTELIAEEVYGPVSGEQREALSGVEESARNLLTLINQILDLSKVESGKIEIYVTETAIHDVAQAVSSEAQAFAKDRPYRVGVECPERVTVQTDRVKVQQILTNLVSNAVKFTEKGSVKIVCKKITDGCAIEVRDTGIGIPPAYLDVIFDEFRQVDGSSTRVYQGTGLGLAIARRFARILGGDVTVTSTVGVGSTFTLKLPTAPPSERVHDVHDLRTRPKRPTLPPALPASARTGPIAIPPQEKK